LKATTPPVNEARKIAGVGRVEATFTGVRKIPGPVRMPRTIIVRSKVPICFSASYFDDKKNVLI
jgi:hypothetical protein